jgi:hypothetical protein
MSTRDRRLRVDSPQRDSFPQLHTARWTSQLRKLSRLVSHASKVNKISDLRSALLKDALLRTIAAAEIAGIRAVLLHAMSDDAKRFYVRAGFHECPIDPMMMMITLAEVEKTSARPPRADHARNAALLRRDGVWSKRHRCHFQHLEKDSRPSWNQCTARRSHTPRSCGAGSPPANPDAFGVLKPASGNAPFVCLGSRRHSCTKR